MTCQSQEKLFGKADDTGPSTRNLGSQAVAHFYPNGPDHLGKCDRGLRCHRRSVDYLLVVFIEKEFLHSIMP